MPVTLLYMTCNRESEALWPLQVRKLMLSKFENRAICQISRARLIPKPLWSQSLTGRHCIQVPYLYYKASGGSAVRPRLPLSMCLFIQCLPHFRGMLHQALEYGDKQHRLGPTLREPPASRRCRFSEVRSVICEGQGLWQPKEVEHLPSWAWRK